MRQKYLEKVLASVGQYMDMGNVVKIYPYGTNIDNYFCPINKFNFSVSSRLKDAFISLIPNEVNQFLILIDDYSRILFSMREAENLTKSIWEAEKLRFIVDKVQFEKISLNLEVSNLSSCIFSICVVSNCINILNKYYGFDEYGNMVIDLPFKRGDIVRLKNESSKFFISDVTIMNMSPQYTLIKMEHKEGEESFIFDSDQIISNGSDMIHDREIRINDILRD